MQAVSDGKLQKEHVPKVHLHATHDAALKEVEYKDLRQYAAPSEAGGSNRQEAHHNPASGGTSVAKEHHEISSHGKWTMVGESRFQKCRTNSSFFFPFRQVDGARFCFEYEQDGLSVRHECTKRVDVGICRGIEGRQCIICSF